ncbi:MAG: protein phosphatase CheZ [Candidatus Methylumidiphilus sp.]
MNTGVELSKNSLVQDEMLARVGQIARSLHENLRSLGYDKVLEKVANEIPDVRDRLNYVAQMTEQAAQRVLNATDVASPLQDKIIADTAALSQEWDGVLSARSHYSAYRGLAEKTLGHLATTQNHAQLTRQQLFEIMMAQDFQDLTGQVVKRIMFLIHEMEQQLVQFLLDYSPDVVAHNRPLEGPQVKTEGKTEIVTSQEQVDSLLDSLGF